MHFIKANFLPVNPAGPHNNTFPARARWHGFCFQKA